MKNLTEWAVGTTVVGAVIGVASFLVHADTVAEQKAAERADLALNGPCHDSATLVATTSGSPNSETCPNRRHRMRFQVQTVGAEEIGALVVCECRRDADGGAP